MSSHYLAQCLLVFLLLYADVTYSKVQYIIPSPDDPCPQNSSCLTLSQFAANSSYNEMNISLLFLPGNHTLDRELLLAQVNNFSMTKFGLDNETVLVECSTRYGRFRISETNSVSVKDLHFISCGSNSVSQVKWLTITGTTFQGVQNRITVLELNEVSNATIVETCFLSNSLYYPNVNQLTYILDYVYFRRITPSGALHTTFCNVSIVSSKFMHNRADIGGALVAHNSSLYLARSIYSYNTANFGGVMVTSGSTIDMDNNSFINNAAAQSGGVMVTYNDTFTIRSTTFNNNSADFSNSAGGVMATYGVSSFVIKNSIFTNNSADFGGVMRTSDDSSFNISNSMFTDNSAGQNGGVMWTSGDSSFNINNSTFTYNSADFGGVMDTRKYSSFNISDSTFTYNSASVLGGVMVTSDDSSSNISNSMFTNNRAVQSGGVIYIYSYSFSISNSMFTNNHAERDGGVISIDGEMALATVGNSIFVNNKAYRGAVIYGLNGALMFIDNSNFHWNAFLNQGEGVIFLYDSSAFITSSIFYQNSGSLYAFNSKLTFIGYNIILNNNFENLMEPLTAGNEITSQEGGAITSFQSTVTFTTESTVQLLYNRASYGGAILATESTIIMNGEITIDNNVANRSGGGISLKQSRLEIYFEKCQIINNVAVRGGGIHASSSTIAVYQPGTLQVTNNSAEFGGGMYLEVNPKLYVLKNTDYLYKVSYWLNFTGNHATNGGAVYVADDTNSDACSPDNECFIQILALYQESTSSLNKKYILFSENTASDQGPNLFGGLLDRCIPSPFAEVYLKQTVHYSGVTYLGNISNIELDSISSRPVRVCFCNSEHEPDCSYQPPVIRVQKGNAFNVSLVVVDQVNHTLNANVSCVITSSHGGFGEGQQTQSVGRKCVYLTFNVFSPHDSETLNLYSNGPCGSATLSTSHVNIKFIDCTCPVGFEPLSNSQSSTRCECVCDSAMSPYITECNITTSSVLRKGTDSWITYINDTDAPEYISYPHCPFDYCQSQTKNITINFNLPNGADSQCAFNRTGTLCGACKDDLSLSLASSRCVPCHAYWPAVFVVILLAAATAGILLVTVLLALNITVSVGLINGFIFYANIVSAGSAIFFRSSEPCFPSVFVAWINLDIGIDVCFIDGLDAYTKTWVELVFPVYIISLVVMVIIVSEHSPRFARLIGKKDPVSTLATLILLSYAKLFSITITALSFAILHYPDGKQETVWLPDGNVKYFQGKHIPLALVALLITVIGLPYTILLFLWQWIVRAPTEWKVFKWTRNTKLNNFIATYHVPLMYNSNYRYWTGLLLLVRIVLYISASVTVSAHPQTFALITGLSVGGLIVFKGVFGLRMYKKAFVDVVVTALYFNLLALSIFSLYDFKVDITKQTAVAYTSTIITFILFIGVVIYHVTLLIEKKRQPEDLIDQLMVPVKLAKEKVTQTVIGLPKRNYQDLSAEDNDQGGYTEYRLIETPDTLPYTS